MQKAIWVTVAGIVAAVAMPLSAQTVQPAVPAAPVGAAPAVAAPQAAPAMTEAESRASQERMAAQEKQAEAERKASEERMKEQEKQAEKERKAAEKQAEADRKAAEKAAADAAAAEKLAAERAAAAAPVAAAPVAMAAAPVAAPLPKDSRDRVVMLCTAEAQRRGKALGAADVSMDEVRDTDVKSDGRASMQAKMNLYTKDSKGRLKKQTKKVKCETKNDVVTSFKVS